MSETHKGEIEAIRALIAAVGGTCNVLHQVGRLRGSSGIPDLYIQIPRAGCSFWVEVKVGKDDLRPEQRAFINREAACRRWMIVGGVDEVIRVMRQAGVPPPCPS